MDKKGYIQIPDFSTSFLFFRCPDGRKITIPKLKDMSETLTLELLQHMGYDYEEFKNSYKQAAKLR